MAKKNQQQQLPVSTPRMGPGLVNQLMIHLLRQAIVANSGVAILQPEHFSVEPHYNALWKSVLALTPKYGLGNIPFEALYFHVAERLADMNPPLPPGLVAQLTALPTDVGLPVDLDNPGGERVERVGLLYHAYHGEDQAALDAKFGIELLQRLMTERAVVDRTRTAVDGASERVPGNFAAELAEINEQLLRVRLIGTKVCSDLSVFPEDPDPIHVFSTGVIYFDQLMNGGHAGGEVYILLGPWKAGKTFMALQIVCGCAELFYLLHQEGGPKKAAYFVSYELPDRDVKHRMRSYGAKISLTRLMEHIKTAADYSTRGKLLQYERDWYSAQGDYHFAELDGERERLERFSKTIGPFVQNIDMVTSSAGDGGVDELAAILKQQAIEGNPPGVVVIDYLNLAVGRQLNARGGNFDREGRAAIIAFQRECIKKIAVPFNVPVWILQQYSADANTSKPTKLLHAADAAESRTVAADSNMVFCLGMPDKDTKVAQLLLDLTRRTKSQGQVRLVQLQGDQARWVDVTGEFEVVEAGGQIVKKAANVVKATVDASAAQKLAKHKPAEDPYKDEAAYEGPPFDL